MVAFTSFDLKNNKIVCFTNIDDSGEAEELNNVQVIFMFVLVNVCNLAVYAQNTRYWCKWKILSPTDNEHPLRKLHFS